MKSGGALISLALVFGGLCVLVASRKPEKHPERWAYLIYVFDKDDDAYITSGIALNERDANKLCPTIDHMWARLPAGIEVKRHPDGRWPNEVVTQFPRRRDLAFIVSTLFGDFR